MRCEAKDGDQRGDETAPARSRAPRTVRPKKIGAGRMKSMPRQASGPIGSPFDAQRLDEDDNAEQSQQDRQHQREIAPGPCATPCRARATRD